jgi:hypothetical protein
MVVNSPQERAVRPSPCAVVAHIWIVFLFWIISDLPIDTEVIGGGLKDFWILFDSLI